MFPFTGERNSSKNSGPPRMHPKDLKRLQRRISQGKNPPSVDLTWNKNHPISPTFICIWWYNFNFSSESFLIRTCCQSLDAVTHLQIWWVAIMMVMIGDNDELSMIKNDSQYGNIPIHPRWWSLSICQWEVFTQSCIRALGKQMSSWSFVSSFNIHLLKIIILYLAG